MCGRAVITSPASAIRQIFGTTNPLVNIPSSWNVAPTHEVPVVRRNPDTGARHLDLLTWGLVPHWTRELASARRPINARAETIGQLPMFRHAFRSRRGIMVADAYYEWQTADDGKTKLPFAIARIDGQPLALAAIWEGWRGPDGSLIRSFSLLTTAARDGLTAIHDRMPVWLEPADWQVWLGEQDGDPAALLNPAPDGVLRSWRVSPQVNSVRNNDATLVDPAECSVTGTVALSPGCATPESGH